MRQKFQFVRQEILSDKLFSAQTPSARTKCLFIFSVSRPEIPVSYPEFSVSRLVILSRLPAGHEPANRTLNQATV